MSLIGAMSAAISGIGAQSAAFGNISDNIANSQTTGFKRVDTNFVDYLTTSTAVQNEPSTVVARPDYINTVQGTITQTDNTLGMAIAGQGFFTVSHPLGVDATGKTQFATQSYYTRAGDFQLDKSGYLVNGSGDYLNGWVAKATNGLIALDKSITAPIQVGQSVYKPVATQNVTMAANLPSNLIANYNAATNVMTDAAGNTIPAMQSQVNIYDSSGASHIIQYTWIPANTAVGANANAVATPPASWTLNATLMGLNGAANTNLGSINLTFAADGTPSAINTATGTAAILPVGPPAGPLVAGDPVTVQFSAALPTVAGGAAGPQNISVNLGNLLQTTGVTQFAATAYTLRSLNQDGVPPGSFSSISTKASGDIYANYDNGQTRLIARVPIATFGNADGLQRQNGSAFTVTLDSGNPSLQDAGTNGSGSIVVKSVEGSNVDIGNEFTKLIVAQRAYSANAKIVTSADEMMQTTLDMKR